MLMPGPPPNAKLLQQKKRRESEVRRLERNKCHQKIMNLYNNNGKKDEKKDEKNDAKYDEIVDIKQRISYYKNQIRNYKDNDNDNNSKKEKNRLIGLKIVCSHKLKQIRNKQRRKECKLEESKEGRWNHEDVQLTHLYIQSCVCNGKGSLLFTPGSLFMPKVFSRLCLSVYPSINLLLLLLQKSLIILLLLSSSLLFML